MKTNRCTCGASLARKQAKMTLTSSSRKLTPVKRREKSIFKLNVSGASSRQSRRRKARKITRPSRTAIASPTTIASTLKRATSHLSFPAASTRSDRRVGRPRMTRIDSVSLTSVRWRLSVSLNDPLLCNDTFSIPG